MNYRPEYSHQWDSKTYYTQLRLDPLGKESAEEMLTALMGDDEGLCRSSALIIERTEGNSLLHGGDGAGALRERVCWSRNGAVKLVKPLTRD